MWRMASARVGRILRESIREQASFDPERLRRLVGTGSGLGGLATAAHFHGVAGFVHPRVASLPVPPEEREGLRAAYYGALLGNAVALRGLAEVGSAFADLGLVWLVLKGPALAEVVYAAPSIRAYSDLDVLVPATSLEVALRALQESAGAALVDRNWALLRRDRKGELHLRMPSGLVVDLHWHLLNDWRLRRTMDIPVGHLLERGDAMTLGGTPTRVLDPTDGLLHLALHSTLSGGNRLVWFKDMERHVACRPPAWDLLVSRAHEWNAGLVAGAALARARSVAGAAIPREVVSELVRSRSWRAVVWGAARLTPPERALGAASVDRMVSRAARGDARSSVAELALRGGLAVRPGRLRSPRDRQRRATDRANPESLLYPAGDDSDLRAYFEGAAAEVRGPAARGRGDGRV